MSFESSRCTLTGKIIAKTVGHFSNLEIAVLFCKIRFLENWNASFSNVVESHKMFLEASSLTCCMFRIKILWHFTVASSMREWHCLYAKVAKVPRNVNTKLTN